MTQRQRTKPPELREYQRQSADEILAKLEGRDSRIMFQLPTGAGKTEVAIAVAGSIMQQNPRAKFVWLTHRDVLVRQTAARFNAAGIPAAAASSRRWEPHTPEPPEPVLVTSPVVLRNRNALPRMAQHGAWHLIVDEAHHAPASTWSRIIKEFPGPVVGLTATPWRLSKKEGFDELFNALICGPQVSDLIDQGYLADVAVKRAKPELMIQGGTPGSAGDYTPGGIMEANDGMVLTVRAVEWWLAETGGERQTIIYAVSQEHAHQLLAELKSKNVSARIMLDSTPEEDREKDVADFKKGRYRVMVNVAILTEGADFPEADCTMMLRPTKSLALYLQMTGRVMRPHGVRRALILDATHNTESHGLPTQDREWSLKARGESGDGEAPVKFCTRCDTAHHTRTEICDQCGHQFGRTCRQCGLWRSWGAWKQGGDRCDRCHLEMYFNPASAADVQTVFDDGWSVSKKGNLWIKHPSGYATLVRSGANQDPEQQNTTLYLTGKSEKRREFLGNVSEERAKRAAEAMLDIGDKQFRRRLRSCQAMVEASTRIMFLEDRRQLVTNAAAQARLLKQDLDRMPEGKTKNKAKRDFHQLAETGARARASLNEAAAPRETATAAR